MKITKSQLKQLIQEEMAKILQEVDFARGSLSPRTPGGKFYVDDPVNPGAQRGSKNPSRQRVKIFDPKTGTNIFDERVPTRGGRGAAAGNRFRHEMEGLYRRAEKVYKKAARFEKIFGDDAVKIMVASAKQGRKAAIKAMVGTVLGTVAAPAMAVYTAVEIADVLANHYIDTYGGGKRLTLPDDQLNDRERRAKQMLEKEVRSSGKILSPADVAAGRFKGVVQPEASAEPAYKSNPNWNPSTGFRESITKSQLKKLIQEELENILPEGLDEDLMQELLDDPREKVSCKEFLQREEIEEAKTPAWQRKAGKNPEGGLNKKGRDSYKGGKLKAPVSAKQAKKSKGGKAAKRRKSFCSRMCGMKKKRTGAKGRRDPDSRINKSLRKWDCNC